MLSIQNVTPGQAGNYYSADDYYTAGNPPAMWLGKGAEAAGLRGPVEAGQLREALKGRVGEIDATGHHNARRAATDLTLSAPKSVSIAGLVEGDRRVIDAHDRAVARAMERAEQLIGARVTERGVTRFERTGNAAIAAIRHETSRAGDPQLHTHCLTLNATQRADGEWRAIENRDILRHQKELDALYKSELQRGLRELGYDMRYTKNGFELAHISQRQIQEFSQRSEAIEAALKARGLERGTASAQARQAATLATRDRKIDFDRPALSQSWRERSAAVEAGRQADAARIHEAVLSRNFQPQKEMHHEQQHQPLADRQGHDRSIDGRPGVAGERMPDLRGERFGLEQKGPSNAVLPEAVSRHTSTDQHVHGLGGRARAGGYDGLTTAREAVDHAKAHCLERESIARLTEIRAEAYRVAGNSGIDTRKVDREIERQTKAGELVVARDKGDREICTTPEARRIEADILATERRGRGAVEPVVSREVAQQAAERRGLSAEQGRAVETALDSRDRIVGIEGRAGTGKTTTLSAVREAAESAGWKVQGIAPQTSAVKALTEAGIQARTQQGWSVDSKAKLDNRTVLIVDEAGLMGSKALKQTLERAEAACARVVLVGDPRQYQAVEAGKPLAQLRDNGMRTAEITEMQRQRNAPEAVREAAQLSAERGQARAALDKLDRGGRVVEVADSAQRQARIARDYAGLAPAERRSTLVLTGTNAARRTINDHVRQELGLAGKGRDVTTFQRGDQTGAEKKLASSYRAGEQLRFEKDYRGIGAKAGEVWTIRESRGDGRVAIERGGEIREIQPARMSDRGVTLGTAETREIAASERLRFNGADREAGYSNGDRGTVTEIEGSRMRVELDSGKRIEIDTSRPVYADHGYAATGHSAQGLGADRVMIDKDTASVTTDHRSFYTDLTRTKCEVAVYTDSKERLADRVSESRDKTSALDIERDRGGPDGPAGGGGRDLGSGGEMPDHGAADRAADRELDRLGNDAYGYDR